MHAFYPHARLETSFLIVSLPSHYYCRLNSSARRLLKTKQNRNNADNSICRCVLALIVLKADRTSFLRSLLELSTSLNFDWFCVCARLHEASTSSSLVHQSQQTSMIPVCLDECAFSMLSPTHTILSFSFSQECPHYSRIHRCGQDS
jgi:hypothetical protein